MNKFNQDLSPHDANHVPLTPLSFIRRSAEVYPTRPAIVYEGHRQDWATTYRRCRQMSDALRKRGIRRNDTVAVLCPNTPPAVEVHFGVPLAGAVLNMINTRLDASAVAFILDHGEAQVLMVDQGLAEVAAEALTLCESKPLVIDIEDANLGPSDGIGALTYESLIAEGDPDGDFRMPNEEWEAIALNYTSGTTGNPKGVVFHHRGAWINALGNALDWSMPKHAVYLWTLPLFHCNGWCFAWTVAARSGTNVCLRAPQAERILDLIRSEHVTHMCGAPIVLNMVTSESERRGEQLDHPVELMTAGAAPPAPVLARATQAGFDVTHAYGLTESFGPNTICAWQDAWDQLPDEEKAHKLARQGVAYMIQEELSVRDPESMQKVPRDGETIGEVMMRGNVIMKGYLKNPAATAEAFHGGHFHTGDLAVMHPDGYIEIRDRSKGKLRPWWPNQTITGAKHPWPLSNCGKAARQSPTR
jgi:fatty-acyl-CoA synthase